MKFVGGLELLDQLELIFAELAVPVVEGLALKLLEAIESVAEVHGGWLLIILVDGVEGVGRAEPRLGFWPLGRCSAAVFG